MKFDSSEALMEKGLFPMDRYHVSCWAMGGQLWGHLRVQRSQEVISQEICLGNQVGDSEDQAKHKIRRLAGSGIRG